MGGPTFYNCQACEDNPALKTIFGHDGPPNGQVYAENLVTGEKIQRCPLRDLLEAPREVVAEIDRHAETYFPAYQHGFLLVAGGIADQPARWVELVQLTARTHERVQAKFDQINAAKPEGDD